MAEVVPGRTYARANFEKVKIYFVNFLLIFKFPFFYHFHRPVPYKGWSMYERECPGRGRPTPCPTPGELRPGELRAATREGAASCMLPGPPLDVQQLRGSCGWKILPIPCSYNSYNVQYFPLGILFIIYLQIIKKLKLDFF